MAINLLGNLNQNNSVNTNTLLNGSISDANQIQSDAVKQLLSQIKELLPGQIIEGKLLETDGSNAKLLLSNNLILNTLIQSDANLKTGQTFSFEIQANNGKQLQIRPLHTNVSVDSTAIKALENASVKVSDETIKMVDSLMKEGMPINKEMINTINRDINSFPNGDIDSIVLLNKLNIPVTEDNIEQMTLYNNNNRWMLENVDSLSSDLSEAITSSISKGTIDAEAFLDELKNILNSEDDNTSVKELLNKQPGDKTVEGLINKELTKALEVFDKIKNLSPEKLTQPNIIKHIKNDITTILTNKLLMEPGEVADKNTIKEYYNKTYEIASKLEQLLSNNAKLASDSAAIKDLNTIKNNISFMNDINEMFNYVQLPLKMADGQANGDLYVYRRNKGKNNSEADEPLTALLHLSMETLGNMDIFLKLENEKLSTKFCLEKEEMIDFIEAHIDELNIRLVQKGYNIDTSIGKMEDKDRNVIDLIQGKTSDVMILSTQTFDARA